MSGTHMSDAQFAQLIATIREVAPAIEAETNVTNKSKGSFSNCGSYFGGERNNDAVEEFITGIEAYKDVEGISDCDALLGLPLLFHGIAAIWWKGVRRDAKTWQDALTLLREHFSPTKPAYQIYMEFFEEPQEDREAIDAFVCKKRELLTKLPEGRHDEKTELDFIYGLLAMKYRQQIPRQEIKSFRVLLDRCRAIEKMKR